jgi:hypothetical protein
MLSLFIIILIAAVLFKFTGFLFSAIGHILGGILGFLFWIFLAWLAIFVFGMAIFSLPIILIVGVIAVIVAIAS